MANRKLIGIGAVFALVFFAAACDDGAAGQTNSPGTQGSATPSVAAGAGEATPSTDAGADGSDPASSKPQAGGSGEYMSGLDRQAITEVIEKTFSSDNAVASWDGDTLTLKLDAEITGPLSGIAECGALSSMLLPTDSVILEFTNGEVDCSEQ